MPWWDLKRLKGSRAGGSHQGNIIAQDILKVRKALLSLDVGSPIKDIAGTSASFRMSQTLVDKIIECELNNCQKGLRAGQIAWIKFAIGHALAGSSSRLRRSRRASNRVPNAARS